MSGQSIVFIVLNKAAINSQFLCFSIISSGLVRFLRYLSVYLGKVALRKRPGPGQFLYH